MYAAQQLPVHPTKRHPLTGEPIQAIWVNPAGRVFWPVIGASGDAEAEAAGAAEAKEAADKAAADAKAAEEAKNDGDKPLGANGEKALKAERDARKELETQLADLKKGLALAIGVTGEEDKPDAAESIAAIQKQMADLQHSNAVLALANEHGITDKDDLALLTGTTDADALKKLAVRLAPTGSNDDTAGKSGRPKPDRSQGSGADDKPSVASGRELFAARRGKKSA